MTKLTSAAYSDCYITIFKEVALKNTPVSNQRSVSAPENPKRPGFLRRAFTRASLWIATRTLVTGAIIFGATTAYSALRSTWQKDSAAPWGERFAVNAKEDNAAVAALLWRISKLGYYHVANVIGDFARGIEREKNNHPSPD
ncbi:MAG: hypothetical protein L6Q57_04730 [Alphaproteobacteria bacterium]|nr:hypothetical protein [Alphaproteobacteria bacterium]